MKKLNLTKNSLHYKLAHIGGLSEFVPVDICNYTRKVIIGFFTSSLILAISIFVWVGLVESVLGIIFSLIYDANLFSDLGLVFSVVIFLTSLTLMLSLGIYYVKRKHRAIKDKNYGRKKRDSFLRAAYKSHKEKYCIQIDFTNKD